MLENGKRRHFYGKARQEVARRLTAALKSRQDGLPVPGERLTVGQHLHQWLENSARPSVRPSTYRSYSDLVRLHIIPELGRLPLAKLSPTHIQAMLNRKLAAGLSPRRVQYIHAVLRRALGQAEKWGLVARNVAKLVDAPRVRYPEVKPFTPGQARAFLEAVADDRQEALFAVALALGLRQAEILGLTWDCVDLGTSTLTVSKTLQRHDRAYHLEEPKTSRSRRALSLPPPLVQKLQARRRRQVEERLQAGPLWSDTWDLVFTTEMGAPVSGTALTHRFQSILGKAGLPRQRFHDLRHSAASFMLAQRVPLKVVQEVLGHSQIAVTANIYAHVAQELQQDAVERVGALLWRQS